MPRINLAKRCHACGRRTVTPQRYFELAGQHLTLREFTIFDQLARGLNQRQVAKVLGIHTSTVWNTLMHAADRFRVVDWRWVLKEFMRVREAGTAGRIPKQCGVK